MLPSKLLLSTIAKCREILWPDTIQIDSYKSKEVQNSGESYLFNLGRIENDTRIKKDLIFQLHLAFREIKSIFEENTKLSERMRIREEELTLVDKERNLLKNEIQRRNKTIEILKLDLKNSEDKYSILKNKISNRDTEIDIQLKDNITIANRQKIQLLSVIGLLQKNLEKLYNPEKYEHRAMLLMGYKIEAVGVDYLYKNIDNTSEEIAFCVRGYRSSLEGDCDLPITLVMGPEKISCLVIDFFGPKADLILYSSEFGNKDEPGLNPLKNLNTYEWFKLVYLVKFLSSALTKNKINNSDDSGIDFVFTKSIFKGLFDKVKNNKRIRYREITLKNETVNLDYEHLWFDITDLSFGDTLLPKFEIRISTNVDDNGNFTNYFKLEIPLINGITKPFTSWYPESNDLYGEKFELRVDMDSESANISDLIRLKKTDQIFLANLLLMTPILVLNLEKNKVNISRPYKSWSDISNHSIRTFLKLLKQEK